MATPTDLLRTALTADPARPFLTFYDAATGERVELSVRTFENWVAKTANLLQDELGLSVGRSLGVALPLHWQAAVWMQAGWALGLEVRPVPLGEQVTGDVVVTTPDAVAHAEGEVVALSLRPALVAATLPGVESDVLAQGDRFVAYETPGPDVPALTLNGRTRTATDLGEVGGPRHARLLVCEALDTYESIAAALLVPLTVDGSAVLVRHPDLATLPALRESEKVTPSRR